MAELLGAIASGVTLAALFQACIEAFDLIQTLFSSSPSDKLYDRESTRMTLFENLPHLHDGSLCLFQFFRRISSWLHFREDRIRSVSR